MRLSGIVRVLLVTTEYGAPGGISTYVEALARDLSVGGQSVTVLALRQERAQVVTEGGVRLVSRRPLLPEAWSRLLSRLRTIDRLILAVEVWWHSRPLLADTDAAETPDWLAPGLGLLRRVPLSVHIHGPLDLIATKNQLRRTPMLRMAGRLERIVAERADAVTAPSTATANMLIAAGWSVEPMVVTSPAPTLPSTPPVPPSRPRRRPVALVVGRLERLKAPELLLDAVVAGELRGEVDCWFAGSSSGRRNGTDYAEWVAHRAQELSVQARLLGPVDRKEMPALYSAAAVVVIPSHFESFSMVALEALEAGVPVVCTDGCGIAPLLRGSEAAAVVPAGDAAAMGAALREVLSQTLSREQVRSVAAAISDPASVVRSRAVVYEGAIRRWHQRAGSP